MNILSDIIYQAKVKEISDGCRASPKPAVTQLNIKNGFSIFNIIHFYRDIIRNSETYSYYSLYDIQN